MTTSNDNREADKMLLDIINGLSYVDEATDPAAFASVTLAELQAVRTALSTRPALPTTDEISALIDRHPLNGQYGFTREDCIEQIREQARLARLTAASSKYRGAKTTMLAPETAVIMAEFTLAALSRPTPTPAVDDHAEFEYKFAATLAVAEQMRAAGLDIETDETAAQLCDRIVDALEGQGQK